MALDPEKFTFEPSLYDSRVNVQHPDFKMNERYTISMDMALTWNDETNEVVFAVKDWLKKQRESQAA